MPLFNYLEILLSAGYTTCTCDNGTDRGLSARAQGNDQDARRRRRAALGEDGDGEAPEFDLAALFPGAGMAAGGGGGGDEGSGDEEEQVARAYAAQRLLEAGSQACMPLHRLLGLPPI